MPLQITELLQPITDAKPGGEDIRYEPIYDQIRQARKEEDELPAGDWSRQRQTADWNLVVKLAIEILTKKSKDLQVAAWLTEAQLKREGFGGLRDGLLLLKSMVAELWDHLYPEIEEGDVEFRAAPLEWVAQYLGPAIRMQPITSSGLTVLDYRDSRAVGYEADADTYEKRDERAAAISAGKITAEDFDDSFASTPKPWYKKLVADMDAAIAAADALEEAGRAGFGADAPRYAPLKDTVQEVRVVAAQLLAKKLELDPDPPEPEPLPDDPVAGTVSPTTAAAGGATLSAVPQTRADADARIAAAARYLRSVGPTDPAPYLMLRGLRWGELRARGGDVDPKLLAAPPTDMRTKLKGLMLDGRHPQLLEAAEELMATPFGRGWLDLQRYVLFACEGLGAGYDYVAAGIRGALRALLRDVPQLPDLTLMDDSPTANVETRRWLQAQGLWGTGDADEEPGPPPTVPHDHARSGAADRLLERIRNEPPQRAVEILLRDAAQQKSARARFMRRSQATRIMVESGLDTVARPILEEMIAQIEKHSLEEWEEGETVALPLGLLYRALSRLDGDSGTREALYLRVCRLDPIQAMHFAASTPDDQGD
jgi:type VI secretion system protein ImpA